jgi:aminoglycoside phosphotransferase (APT) family kinase protein
MTTLQNSPEISEELVAKLIKHQFQHWGALPIKFLPGGWDNRLFRLGDDMVVRLPSAAHYSSQPKKEFEWLPKLAARLPLPIPNPLGLGQPAENYPWHWSILRWIEGEPAAVELIDDLNQFARDLADFLTALHKVPTLGGPPPSQYNFHRGGPIHIYEAETLAAIDVLSDRIDAVSALAICKRASSSLWQGDPLWVHGDIKLGNLLIKDGRLSAVIDFGSMAIGDPACDLAIAWTPFCGESRDAFKARLRLSEDIWERAMGWALWKAAITAAGHDPNQRTVESAWRTILELTKDYRDNQSRRSA